MCLKYKSQKRVLWVVGCIVVDEDGRNSAESTDDTEGHRSKNEENDEGRSIVETG
jgi:hypothetical protein